MPIAVTRVCNNDGLYVSSRGTITGGDIIELNNRSLGSPSDVAPQMFTLADMTETREVRITERESQVIAQQFSMLARTARQGAVVAIVAQDESILGAARIWEARLESEFWQSEVFSTVRDAEMWILEMLKKNFGVRRESLELPRVLTN